MSDWEHPELIVVQVAPDFDNLKIVWNIGGVDFDPYLIPVKGLRATSEKIRARLQQLVDHVTEGKTEAAAAKLRELSVLGYDLYLDLFAAERNGDVAEEVKKIIARSKSSLIMFKVKQYLHVPWGLIYDVPPERRGAGADDLDSYRDFWCIKYRASAINKMITPKEAGPIPESYLRVLTVVNRSAFLKAARALEKQERTALRAITNLEFKEPVFSREEFFSRWQSVGNEVNFLCFYGHAHQAAFRLGEEEDPITVLELNRRMQRRVFNLEQSGCLIFMNGCLTAVGMQDEGFLQATGREGFCGFIGTEAKVPDLFALRFGTQFLHAFLQEGRRVHEIMSRLREEYWPLSLVYSTCCYPHKYVEKPTLQPGIPPADHAPGATPPHIDA